MTTTLGASDMNSLLDTLAAENRASDALFQGEVTGRAPVHVVYGGAQLFKCDTARKLGDLARKALAAHAPDAKTFAEILGFSPAYADAVYERVTAKLAREAVEDFRIDFEDGFGSRPDAEEDREAVRAARELGKGFKDGLLPPFVGFRVKSLAAPTAARAVRTADLFLTALAAETGGRLPPEFRVTLPKITAVAQVTAFSAVLGRLEGALGFPANALGLEIMVEHTRSLFLPDGRFSLPLLASAAGARLVGAHLGAYDFTAIMGVTSTDQRLDHPACDFARTMMKAAFAGMPVHLSDGANNLMPIGDAEAVRRSWRTSYGHIRRALKNGFFQGWDLHPAQIPVRYGACYAFFLDGLAAATERLSAFIAQAAQATLSGAVFDDAATGQGLLNFFLRGLGSGALTVAEAAAAGLTPAELATRSFQAILEKRRSPA